MRLWVKFCTNFKERLAQFFLAGVQQVFDTPGRDPLPGRVNGDDIRRLQRDWHHGDPGEGDRQAVGEEELLFICHISIRQDDKNDTWKCRRRGILMWAGGCFITQSVADSSRISAVSGINMGLTSVDERDVPWQLLDWLAVLPLQRHLQGNLFICDLSLHLPLDLKIMYS